MEDVGVLLDLDVEVAVVVEGEGLVAAPGRQHAFDEAGDGERLHPRQLIGQVAQSLAEQNGGLEHVEGLRADLLPARAAGFPAERGREDRLVGCAREELVLERHLEIAGATLSFAVRRGIEKIPVSREGEAQVGEDALGELARETGDLPRRYPAGPGLLDVEERGERELVRDERVVDGERGREEAFAREPVRGRERGPDAQNQRGSHCCRKTARSHRNPPASDGNAAAAPRQRGGRLPEEAWRSGGLAWERTEGGRRAAV